MDGLDAVARLRFIADGAKQVEDAIARVRDEGVSLDKSFDRLERDMSRLSSTASKLATDVGTAGSAARQSSQEATRAANGWDAYSKSLQAAQKAQRDASQRSVMSQFGASAIPAKSAEDMTISERRATLAAYEAQTVSVIGKLRQMEAAERSVNKAVAERYAAAKSQSARSSISSGVSGFFDNAGNVSNVTGAQKWLADYDAQVNALASKSSPRLRYALYDVATTAGVLSTAITAAGAAVGVLAAQQESAFTNVQRTLDGGTTESVARLRKELVGLTREIPQSFANVAEIATLGNQLGIQAQDIAKFTETVAKFSAVTGISAEASAQAFGSLGQILGVGANQYENLGSSIAYVARTSVATDAEILSLTKEIGQQATSAGFAADQVIGLAGALASLRVPPERARGALTTYFQTLNQLVAEGGDKLELFASLVGRTSQQLTADVAGGRGAQIFKDFAVSLSQLNTVDATKALDELGLSQLRVADTFTRVAANLEVYDQALAGASQSFRDGKELGRQYAMVIDDIASRWQIFINAVQEAGAAVGAVLGPAIVTVLDLLAKIAQGFAAFVNTPLGQGLVTLSATIGGITTALAGVVTVSALAVGSLAAVRTAAVELGIVSAGTTTGLSGLVGALLGLQTATGGAAIAFKVLKGAMVATGIGALIVLLGTLIQMAGGVGPAIIDVVNFLELMYNSVGKFATPFRNLFGVIGGLAAMFDRFSGSALTAAQIVELASKVIFGSIVQTGNDIVGAAQGFVNWGRAVISVVTTVARQLLGPLSGIVGMFQQAGQLIGAILKPIGDALSVFGSGFTDGLSAFDSAVGSGFDQIRNFAASLPSADDALSSLGDTAALTADNLDGGTGSLGDAADGAAAKVRTLTDYASDLSGVMSRAFDLRFGNQQALDTITGSWSKIASTIADAREEMAGYVTDLQGMAADRTIKQYWLSVAENYGDALRAQQLRADLADLDKKQTDTQKKLSLAQDKTTKTLDGNSDAAIANRAEILGLVTNYQAYIKTLAENGMEQADLQATSARLKQEFIQQAVQMGYSRTEVDRYAAAFDSLGTIIRNVPRNITVTANTDPAYQALNEFLAKANEATASATIGGIGGGFDAGYAAGKTVGEGVKRGVGDYFNDNPLAFRILTQGQPVYNVPGTNLKLFKSGGYTGNLPENQAAGITHGREYVMSAPAVRNAGGPNAMNTIHNLLKSGKGFMPSGLAAVGGVVELSPVDRALLAEIADRVGLTISNQTLQATVNGANGAAVSRRAG